MRENQTRLEQDVLHWKRRAGLAEGDENSASVRLESYYKDLSSLKLEVSIYESKLKVTSYLRSKLRPTAPFRRSIARY